MHANSSNLTLIRDAATPAWPSEPYAGGPEGTSESDPVGVAPVLAKRSRPSMYIVDAIPALSGTKGFRWSSLHPLMMSEAVARRSIVIVTSDGVACSS